MLYDMFARMKFTSLDYFDPTLTNDLLFMHARLPHTDSGVGSGEGVPRPQGWGDASALLQTWSTCDMEHFCW